MNTPHTKPKKIRLTIPVTEEVHAAFQRIGAATSIPTGRAMGEWLGDTLDAAQYLADTLEKARAAPKLVAQQLHAYALGLSDETGAVLSAMRKGAPGATGGPAKPGPGAAADPFTPRPSNTGGKVPRGTSTPPGGKS